MTACEPAYISYEQAREHDTADRTRNRFILLICQVSLLRFSQAPGIANLSEVGATAIDQYPAVSSPHPSLQSSPLISQQNTPLLPNMASSGNSHTFASEFALPSSNLNKRRAKICIVKTMAHRCFQLELVASPLRAFGVVQSRRIDEDHLEHAIICSSVVESTGPVMVGVAVVQDPLDGTFNHAG